ncbi:MAG: hypothetical protein COY58_07600 [Gammaproteobacteria bacterium CG_4_10_14_0_8_um_filter_38_16]|nr:MAG: hypothetical protein COY58_07600 [Gammaproteobacteria bacterium CG_4_10_14_0_8_um_filter_38_16]PJA02682.1 MAG: hypothetical protein COX72_09120 [Gammaproteobacteria bacterium CG_4_10_14_0_2_um_filter_38_22]PJB10858.1 MAG: hypothetical protein CO120_02655 [Gammaproteobacteria bacterium CG_4_9_14_3_um_filter_38_9]
MQSKLPTLNRCLKPLLKLLKWQGDELTLFESLPHFSDVETTEQFQSVLKNLGFESNTISLKIQQPDERLFPCLLLLNDDDSPKILIEKNKSGLLIYDSKTDKNITIPDSKISGVLISFKKESAATHKEKAQHWFQRILFSEKKLLFFVFFLIVLQTLCMVVPSLYVIGLYDFVITSNSFGMLLAFFIGICIIFIALSGIMFARTRFLGYVGIRIQKNIGNAIFKQLLKLPPIYTENASVPMQIMRLNDFNVLRSFFSGSLFVTTLEFPCISIYFAVVWLVGGVLVLIPVIALIISFLLSIISWRTSRSSIGNSASAASDHKDFLLESFWGLRSLQYAGLQEKWISRFREISAKACYFSKKLQFTSQVNDIVFNILSMMTGLATLVVGTILVINNQLNLGALIGTMFMIWRILTPIRSINTMLPKIMQLKISAKHINDLMNLPAELPTERQWKNAPRYIVGALEFSQVTFRYPNTDSPALKNISFTIKTGEMLLVIGPSASGKSTMANLILEIYSPQAGHIYIDGHNIKQYDVNILRKNIAYVPQRTELFYGTIAQNIAFSQPLASQEQIIEAAKAANLLDDLNLLPEGLNTPIRFYSDEKLGAAFCQKINLARAYLRDAPILIMDEPTGTLDEESTKVFENFLLQIKKKKTIIIFGHNTRFLSLADTGMILYDGYIVKSGEPKTIIENLPQGMI